MENSNLNGFFADQQRKMEAKKAKMKKGPNVVHLSYFSQHFSDQDIQELEREFELLDLELSSYDNSGVPQNSLSGMMADATLFLTQPGIVGIITSGLLTNALYDGLKSLIIACWRKVNGKVTVSMTANTVTERVSRFSLVIRSGDEINLEFKTENLDESSFKYAIDQISLSLEKLNSSESAPGKGAMKYDEVSKLWLPCSGSTAPEIIRTVTLEDYIRETNSRSAD